MGCPRVWLSSGMHPFSEVGGLRKEEGERFALYHGNLAVAENYHAVEYLLDNVFAGSEQRLVVAGNEPPAWLRERIEAMPNVRLVDSPDDETMQRLVGEAHVCVMVTEQATGLKLKLLNSLYAGRFCLVNSAMVAGTGLEGLCTIADTPKAMRSALGSLMDQDFTETLLQERRRVLQAFAPQQAVKVILDLI